MVKTKKKQKYLQWKGFALMHEQYFNVKAKFARANRVQPDLGNYKLVEKWDYRKWPNKRPLPNKRLLS